jgi:membrane-bound ClpP family serine protease
VAGAVRIGKRVGYLLLLAAVVLVVAGLAGDFSGGIAASATACLVAGAIVLAPAIVLGYAVKAAERHDREQGF